MAGLLLSLGIVCGAAAQTAGGWQPGPGYTQVAIWPEGRMPDARAGVGPETVEVTSGKDLVAGRPWTSVGPVSRPTMTVYRPQGRNIGAAVVVFPGGGYQILAMDLEGTEVCDWLTAKGITCVLLKYRVPGEGKEPRSGPYPESPEALEDAQRTVGLVRAHAAEFEVNPKKIGVLGFSAGGHLVAAISNHADGRVYRPLDTADQVSCRPDFAVAIYPGHLAWGAARWDATQPKLRPYAFPRGPAPNGELSLNPDLKPTRATPPTFLLQNEDDHVDSVDDALSYFLALKKAGVPVEMHVYAQGGHAFGLRRTRLAATAWPALVEVWLRSLGIVAE